MEYYTGDKILKKSNDVIIDRFIKWMIFNPKVIGMISIITLISIVQSIFLIIDIWNIFMIFLYLIISASSLMMPIIYLNDSIFGKRLYKEEKYRLEHNYHLKK
ncbi:hypothetical protein M0Q50_09405 [bacterium]|jgi:hypothetical protein|nr:hypothetical protein [bacterium]